MSEKSLEARIKQARQQLRDYPDWVVRNSVFQGGATSEYRSVVSDNRGNERESGKKKLVR